jgi:hypothetical protein
MPDRINTPWDASQTCDRTENEDATFYSTASHGGYRVSGELAARVRHAWPGKSFEPATLLVGESVLFDRRPLWLEEDCEWSLLALVAPELFDERSVAHAVNSFRTYYAPDRDTRYGQTAGGEIPSAALEIAARWCAKSAELWEIGALGSAPAGLPRSSWWVSFYRVHDRARRSGIWPEYPKGPTFTNEQLDSAGIAPAGA